MKRTNLYSKLKQKIKNSKYDFCGNFLYHIIVPLFIVVLGCILAFTINLNLGLDFKGGTLATVVVENDIFVDENYYQVKNKLDDILNENNIKGLIYQKVETSYYGSAITVKFDRITNEQSKNLRNDLINGFYPDETDESELEIFVKVDNFSKNVSDGVLLSTALAILVMIVVATVYICARFGISAGFVSGIVSLFNLITLLGLLSITRVEINISTVIAFVFTAVYSILSSMMLVSKVNENINKEVFAKNSNSQIMNYTIKDVFVSNTLTAIFMFLIAFLLGVVPTFVVRSASLPVVFGVLISYYSSMFIAGGLWSNTYIKRKVKQKQEIEDKKMGKEVSQEDLEKTPEVIVETEAKE